MSASKRFFPRDALSRAAKRLRVAHNPIKGARYSATEAVEAWPPVGAVTALDFENGRYYFDGLERARAATIEQNLDWGTFDDTKIVAGVGVRVTGSSLTQTLFVLTTAAAAGLLPSDGGFTCVINYSNSVTGVGGQAGVYFEALDLPNYSVEWMATFSRTVNGQSNSLSSNSGATPIGDAGDDHVAAVTMEPGNIAASVDGNEIAVVLDVADNAAATHIAVGVSIANLQDAVATAIIRSMVFYLPAENAALPGMAVA